jgi:AcrR family transcriptional regulator
VAPYRYDENGRRVVAPSKGELREKKILDEAEKQLVDAGPERLTVESIATAAGLTRGALYFYFRSKNDVLAALVQRITVELTGAVATRQAALPHSSHDALLSAIDLTRDLWARHGAVMRAAVELSPSVPVIEQLWGAARVEAVDSITALLIAAEYTETSETRALVGALVGMTERVFYEASRSRSSLDDAAKVVTTIWDRTFPPSAG